MKNQFKIFSKFGIQMLYIIIIPFFFLAFVVIYEPFGILQSPIATTRTFYQFNIAMIMCIILLVIITSRVLVHSFRNKINVDKSFYRLLMVAEIVTISLFTALYVTLITKGQVTYFSALLYSTLYLFSILIYPYLLLELALLLKDANEAKNYTEINEGERIRFYDDRKALKFVVSASSILFIEAQENYVLIHYLDGEQIKTYQLRTTMKKIDESLSFSGLIRCHRSYFVNPNRINALRKDKDNMIYAELNDKTNTSIPISKKYYEDVSAKLQ